VAGGDAIADLDQVHEGDERGVGGRPDPTEEPPEPERDHGADEPHAEGDRVTQERGEHDGEDDDRAGNGAPGMPDAPDGSGRRAG